MSCQSTDKECGVNSEPLRLPTDESEMKKVSLLVRSNLWLESSHSSANQFPFPSTTHLALVSSGLNSIYISGGHAQDRLHILHELQAGGHSVVFPLG